MSGSTIWPSAKRQRRHRRLYAITAASVAGMLFTSGLAYTAIEARDEARDQRREAEGLIGFMLGDLREKLEPVGRLDVLDAVGARALAYYRKAGQVANCPTKRWPSNGRR